MTTIPARIDPADWITLCQSELAALAVDREFAEGLASAAEAWNACALALWTARATDDAPRSAGPDAPTGPSPAGAASGDGGIAAPADAR